MLPTSRADLTFRHSTPPPAYFKFADAIFELRRFLVRYLALPRPAFMRVREVSDHPDPKTGRLHTNRYVAHPFYSECFFLYSTGLLYPVARSNPIGF